MKFPSKVLLIAFAVALNFGSAFAASPAMISCSAEDGDLIVAISPSGKLGTFWDNDHYTALGFTY